MREMLETLVTYYQGAYGPTIRVDVQSKEWLEYLKSTVTSLIEGDITEIEVGGMDSVKFSDLKSLLLRRQDAERVSNIILDLKEDEARFVWLQSKAELVILNGLVDGLLDSKMPGHQYLTNECDGILVVLAYKEYRGFRVQS